MSKTFNKRKLQMGSLWFVITAAAVAIVILINVAVTALDDRFGLRADLTEEHMYTLSEQSKEILRAVDSPTVLYYLDSSARMSTRIRTFLEQYTMINPLITTEAFDPASRPSFVTQFDTDGTGVPYGSIIVATADNARFRVLSVENDLTDTESGGTTYFVGETVITSAIRHLTEEAEYRAFFVTGHGEANLNNTAVANLAKLLRQDNYIVGEVDLLKDASTLRPKDVLIMLGPTTDLSPSETMTLKEFIDNDGRLLLTLRPAPEALPNLSEWLAVYDMGYKQNMVYETNPRQYWDYASTPLAYYGGGEYIDEELGIKAVGHLIGYDKTDKMAYSILPNCCEITYTDKHKDYVTMQDVFRVSPEAFVRTDLSETSQSKTAADRTVGSNGVLVAAYYEKVSYYQNTIVTSSRILLLGSTDFATDTTYSQLRVNKNMFASAVYQLAGREENIGISDVKMSDTTLTISSAATAWVIRVLVVIVVPGAILLAGLLIWRRRRYL
ncbi:MAG: GldG family protein [Eubacteriales bacterium]|nr:GldG family protein [Eubacteriales bacterium]